GLIWVNLYEPTDTALSMADHWLAPEATAQTPRQGLRSFVLHADIATVKQALERYPQCDPQLGDEALTVERTACAVSLSWPQGETSERLVFLLQPARAQKTIVHALLDTRHTTQANLQA